MQARRESNRALGNQKPGRLVRTRTSLGLTVTHVSRTYAEPTGSGWDTHSWGAQENKDGTHITVGRVLLSPLVGSMPTSTLKSLQWPFLVSDLSERGMAQFSC